MAFHHRKIMNLSISTTHPFPPIIVVDVDEHPPPSHVDEHWPPSHVDEHWPPSHHSLSAAVIIVAVVLASAFLLVIVSVVYLRYRRRRLREATPAARPPPPPPPLPPPLPPLVEDFLDEDHSPVVDHPIWYIRTAGLNPSVISAITVCKYKVGDGLVEGTDCAVCLSEFEEGETLRLLPKCHHAFHIPCIDTWLRSHTNCPLCRAGIVADLAPPPTPLPASVVVASSGRHVREPSVAVISEEASGFRNGSDDGGGGVGGDIESGLRNSPIRHENENLTEEDLCVDGLPAVVDDIQSLRRSVSLYSLSESIKNMGFATVVESSSSAEDTRNRGAKDEKSDLELVVARRSDVKQNQSLIGVMMNGSSRGRSLQPGPSFVKRSLSCGAKLFMARYRRTT